MVEKKKKKTSNRKKPAPSGKMLKAAKLFTENLGVPMGKILREAGYAASTASTPQNVTSRKTWAELMEQYLPEDLVAKTHNELFEATRPVLVGKGKVVLYPDNDARHKAVDTAIKLRGKYAAEQINITRRKYAELSNEELVALKAKAEKFLRKK